MQEMIPYLLIFVALTAILGWICYFFGKKKGIAQNKERVSFLEAKFHEKAEELGATKFSLEKARYELVKLASEMNEKADIEEELEITLREKALEIKRLKKENSALEKALKKNQVMLDSSLNSTSPKLTDIQSHQRKTEENGKAVIKLSKKNRKVA